MLRRDKLPSRKWFETETSKVVSASDMTAMGLQKWKYVGYQSCFLGNQDKCSTGDFVIWKDGEQKLCVGEVLELLQIVGSPSELERRPDIVLLRIYSVQRSSGLTSYGGNDSPKLSSGMPRIKKTHTNCAVDYQVSILHVIKRLMLNISIEADVCGQRAA